MPDTEEMILPFLEGFRRDWSANEEKYRRLRDNDMAPFSQLERAKYERCMLYHRIVLKLAGQSAAGLSGRPELAELIEVAQFVATRQGVEKRIEISTEGL